jgi:uncharacterized protein
VPILKLRSNGRGRRYSIGRGLLESALRVAYQGDWPARVWGALPQTTEIAVSRERLSLPEGPGESCRLAFVSDLHVGPTTPMSLLERTFERLRAERPDVLLLGGDYVYLEAEPHRLAVLGALVASVPCETKLAVLGNHDLWTLDEAIADTLSQAGARVLINAAAQLPAPWSDVAVIGLDDPWTGECDPKGAAAGLDGEAFRIVLCHSPDGLGVLSDLSFHLFLAGHTHGGQIAAPWGPIVLPAGRMCDQYPGGPGRFGSARVYISRGVGTVELPIRTFASPEILIVELWRPARASAG